MTPNVSWKRPKDHLGPRHSPLLDLLAHLGDVHLTLCLTSNAFDAFDINFVEAVAGDNILPLFALEEGGLGRLGIEAKAPAPAILATGRLALAPTAGGNGSPIHPQLSGRLHLRRKADRLLDTGIVDTHGLDCLRLLLGTAPAVRIGVAGMASLFGFAAPLEIVHIVVAAVPVFVIGCILRGRRRSMKGPPITKHGY